MSSAVRCRIQGASAPKPERAGDRLRVGITMTTALATSAHAPATGCHRWNVGPSRAARVACYSLSPSVVVISVHGEIDASNAGILTEQVSEHATHTHGVVLDLTGLEFFGIDGFSALHRVAVSCARTGIDWVVVPGAAVSRTLQICDPQGSLPAVGTVGAAMATFPGRPPHRLQPPHHVQSHH